MTLHLNLTANGNPNVESTQPHPNGWERISSYYVVPAYRDGWWGVWDSFMAALTRYPRLVSPVPVTISFFAKKKDDATFVWASQIEYDRYP